MGRRAFLTRLALGRSAFEPLVPEASQEAAVESPEEVVSAPKTSSVNNHNAEQSSVAESPGEEGRISRSSSYEQQFDKKGYPENTSSKALKRHWRHAVNDVLATVGVCVAKGQESMPLDGAYGSSRILAVRLENNHGIFISAADSLLKFGSEYWTMALRQRLQTFKFYAGIPLSQIIKSEWKHFGGLQLLFSGVLSSWSFIILNTIYKMVTKYVFERLKSATDGVFTPDSWRERLKDMAIDYTEMLTNFALFALIAPLEIYGTLQRLDLISAWPLLPHPRAYTSGLSAIFIEERRLGYLNPPVLSPLFYIWFRRNNGIELKIYDYLWAALPKPTRPDRFSLIGAQEDGFDSSSIAGLADQDSPHDEWVSTTVTGRLAYDLQSVGRNWQIFYDRCARALNWNHQTSRSSDLAEYLRRDPALVGNLRAELAREQNLSHALDSSTAINLEPYGQETPHDPPNHFSPPQSPSTILSHPSTPGSPSRSNSSSPLPSLPASPRPIELTSHNDNGEVHVNLTILAPPGMTRHTTMTEAAHRARSIAALPHVAGLPEGALWPTDPTDMEQTFGSAEPATRPDQKRGIHHRITALSAHPAESMAQRLSSLLIGMLCLPFEALFVRSVATAFLSSPRGSSASEISAARWKGEIYPLGSWFGPGLSTGGWKGVGDYVGKMVLVQGLEAGVAFMTWQVGMGVVWWVGRTWCAWKKPKPADSMREPRRVQWEWSELSGGSEMRRYP